MDDHALLRKYVEQKSEPAFAELVGRHVNLVYGAALRTVGDTHLAQDVAQQVFVQFARRAGTVRRGEALGGWLYRAARGCAVDAVRKERRRREWESEAMKRHELEASAVAWETLAPLLEEAMGGLKRGEQDALVLRYFENQSLRETGETLGLSEDAAQKRVSRAVEKLRAHFARRGVTGTAAALTAAIAENAVQAAPAGLAGRVTGPALAGAGGSGMLAGWLAAHPKLSVGLAAGGLAVASLPVIGQAQENARLRADMAQAGLRNVHLGGKGFFAGSGDGKGGGTTDAELDAQIQRAVQARFSGPLESPQGMTQATKGYLWLGDWRKFADAMNPEDALRALSHIERVEFADTRAELRAPVLGRWASSNPRAAMAYALAVPETEDSGYGRSNAVWYVLDTWSKQDLPAAQAYVEQMPADALRDGALDTIALMIEKQDPEAALDYVRSHASNHLGTDNNYLALFLQWPAGDFPRVAKEVAGMTRDEKNAMINGLLQGWSKTDPAAAAAWLEGLTDLDANAERETQRKQDYYRSVMPEWVKSDPQGALAWTAQLPESERSGGFSTALAYLGPANVSVAETFVNGLPGGAARDDFEQVLLKSAGPADPQMALATLANVPEGAERDKATLDLVKSWVGAGGRYYTDRTPEMIDVAGWVAALPDEALRTSANKIIMGSWSQGDPVAAEQWLETLPAGKDRDPLTYSLFVYNERTYSAQLARWAESMGKGTQRSIMQNNIALDWLKQDRPAALAWIAQSPLFSAKQKQSYLKQNGGAAQ